MQRSSFNRKYPNSNDMRQTTFQKGFDYVSCHEGFPLELKGNMKKHSRTANKDELKSLINYEASTLDLKKISKADKCQQGQFGQQINKENKPCNALAQKILMNNKMNKESYQKSIVPSQDLRSSKQRPQSVKTYKQNRTGSGVNYLLSSNEKNLYKKPQKRHVEEYHIPRRQSFGRKCNLSAPKQTESSQIVQRLNETQPKVNSSLRVDEITINSATFGVIHPSTTNKRIHRDIHSSYANKESVEFNIQTQTKNDCRNQFKTGTELGYEFKKSKQIASQKINQMIGNQSYWKKTNQTESLRQKRDDWRRSAFVIE